MDSTQKNIETSGPAKTKQRKQKSFLDVKLYEPITKKFTISKEAENLLSAYIAFLNSQNDSNVKKFNEDSVIEALLMKLNDDKNFSKWKQSQKSQQNHIDG